MVKNNGCYLNYLASLDRAISDCNRSIRYTCYWHKVEWRFRLRRAFKKVSTNLFSKNPKPTSIFKKPEISGFF